MYAEDYVKACYQNPFHMKEIDSVINENIGELIPWCETNVTICDITKPGDVSKTLIQLFNKLIKAGASIEIAKLVYTRNTVIAVIMANQYSLIRSKSTYNKIMRLYLDILGNSKHFTMMYRKSAMKHARTIKVAPKMPVELFWLIPLFTNPAVFVQFNFEQFSSMIESYLEISRMVPGFMDGFENIVNSISIETAASFREFMSDTFAEIKSLKSKSELASV